MCQTLFGRQTVQRNGRAAIECLEHSTFCQTFWQNTCLRDPAAPDFKNVQASSLRRSAAGGTVKLLRTKPLSGVIAPPFDFSGRGARAST